MSGCWAADPDGGARWPPSSIWAGTSWCCNFRKLLEARRDEVFATLEDWRRLRERIEALGEPFRVEPKCRFRGEPLEHWTFFLQDPSGNWLEFKHYSDPQAVLGRRELSEVGDRDLR